MTTELIYQIAGGGGLITIALAIFKTWQHNNNKIVQHDVRIGNNEKELVEMSRVWEKRFGTIEKEVRENSQHTREENRILQEQMSKMNENVSFIRGYLTKQQEMNQNI
jgi:hypothetical protein